VNNLFDTSSEDNYVIATMIERDFLVAIERQQQSLAVNRASHARVREAQRHSGHWLSVLVAGWWPARSA
jgi:hypothetical protein